MKMSAAVALVLDERTRQERLWGGAHRWGNGSCASEDLSPLVKLAVLAEETGEVARAVFEVDEESLRDELVQVAAVTLAWLESLS